MSDGESGCTLGAWPYAGAGRVGRGGWAGGAPCPAGSSPAGYTAAGVVLCVQELFGMGASDADCSGRGVEGAGGPLVPSPRHVNWEHAPPCTVPYRRWHADCWCGRLQAATGAVGALGAGAPCCAACCAVQRAKLCTVTLEGRNIPGWASEVCLPAHTVRTCPLSPTMRRAPGSLTGCNRARAGRGWRVM